MKMTRTPLRISLVGGGSDMPEFYSKHGGAVVSFAINHYVYVIVNNKFDGRNRVSYGETTENVDNINDIQHDLVRHALNLYHRSGVEVVSVADIPGRGTGLGSSSSFTTGLCAALAHERNGSMPSRTRLAEEAFLVEAKLAGHPVGKQDMYAAAYGGFHHYAFMPDHVEVTPICLSEAKCAYMHKHFLLLYTGLTRDANPLLTDNKDHIAHGNGKTLNALHHQKVLADDLLYELQHGKVANIGMFLHKSWELKKRMGATNPTLDDLYVKALNSGAIGGKLCGAGQGGFFLFWADPSHHEAIITATGLRHVPFNIVEKGCEVIHG